MKSTVEALEARILAITESRVEYETSHPDAGDNHASSVHDSCVYHNTDDHIKDHIMDNDLLANFELDCPTDEWIDANMDDIMTRCLELFEMQEGHIFSMGRTNSYFILALFPVGQVETEIDEMSIDDIGTPWSRHLALTWLAENSREICIRYNRYPYWISILSYETTDACWLAVINNDVMIDILTEIVNKED